MGYIGFVFCLQYDECVIVIGFLDFMVRVWDVNMGEVFNILIYYNEVVLYLCFSNGLMVICFKDCFIVVWDMVFVIDIILCCVLVGYWVVVNVVDFDDKYIVFVFGDRIIKVWSMSICEFVCIFNGYK